MTNDEAALKLKTLSDEIELRFSKEEIKEIVLIATDRVNKAVAGFVYNECYRLFHLERFITEQDLLHSLSEDVAALIDEASSVPNEVQFKKIKRSILFKTELVFNRVSDHFMQTHGFSANSQTFERIVQDAEGLHATGLTRTMMQGFYPNEDVEKIISDLNQV